MKSKINLILVLCAAIFSDLSYAKKKVIEYNPEGRDLFSMATLTVIRRSADKHVLSEFRNIKAENGDYVYKFGLKSIFTTPNYVRLVAGKYTVSLTCRGVPHDGPSDPLVLIEEIIVEGNKDYIVECSKERPRFKFQELAF